MWICQSSVSQWVHSGCVKWFYSWFFLHGIDLSLIRQYLMLGGRAAQELHGKCLTSWWLDWIFSFVDQTGGLQSGWKTWHRHLNWGGEVDCGLIFNRGTAVRRRDSLSFEVASTFAIGTHSTSCPQTSWPHVPWPKSEANHWAGSKTTFAVVDYPQEFNLPPLDKSEKMNIHPSLRR